MKQDDEGFKWDKEVIKNLFGYIFVMIIITILAFYVFGNDESSCHVNPYYGDDGCYDQYEP